jgi:hypothetical protein
MAPGRPAERADRAKAYDGQSLAAKVDKAAPCPDSAALHVAGKFQSFLAAFVVGPFCG